MRASPPWIRSRMWKWLYQRMAKSQKDSEFRFMNYGYNDDNGIELEIEDERDRLFIQLYHMNIRDADLSGKNVLEVGSGRGGGAFWIARTLSPLSLTAVDYSKDVINLCRTWYSDQENLRFVVGNAEELPFDPESFDVVYNVESSHCYANIAAFLREVFRVLKPRGKFCWTDIRDRVRMEKLHQQFLGTGFEILSSKEVTPEVIDALDKIDQGRREMIRKRAPASLRRSFETFGGVPGTPVYQAFKNGELNYFRYLLVKP
ncbi:MAG: class I SAM-dependent methyltransferase [Candidatus Thalassarchaeaceae archaeon]|nr:class I SAM-dependent methyltransferase [Candidatus Thalassarchaeaceae archaeon]